MLSPKLQREGIGKPMTTSLRRVILHSRMDDQFDIISFPDDEFYRIKVYRLDESGELLPGRKRERGFEFFKVEIQSPEAFFISFFDNFGKQRGSSRRCKSLKNPTAEEVLLDRLCNFWINSI